MVTEYLRGGSLRYFLDRPRLKFSEKQNMSWKLPMPGKAWSSPVVMDGKVWLTNAEPEGYKMWAIQVDWHSGKELKKVLVFENKEPQYCHPMNSYGTPTPVIYDGRVFVHFGTHGTAALDAQSGQVLWERRDFKCDHFRGAAASPIVFNDSLIVHFDGHDLQYIVCLDQKTGKTSLTLDLTLSLCFSHLLLESGSSQTRKINSA